MQNTSPEGQVDLVVGRLAALGFKPDAAGAHRQTWPLASSPAQIMPSVMPGISPSMPMQMPDLSADGFPRTPQQARCRYNRVVRGGVRNRAAAAPPRVLVLPLNDENLSPVERTDSLDSVATAALSEVSPSPSPPPPPDFAAKPLNFVCAAADCGAQNELKIPAVEADESNRVQVNCHACAALNEVTLAA